MKPAVVRLECEELCYIENMGDVSIVKLEYEYEKQSLNWKVKIFVSMRIWAMLNSVKLERKDEKKTF